MLSPIRSKPFKPMLAYNGVWNVQDICFPVLCTPKLDGIRCLRYNDEVQTRTGKSVPNRYISYLLAKYLPNDCDGEIVTLNDNGKLDNFHTVQSKIMSEDGEPQFVYHCFDIIACGAYADRMMCLQLTEISDNLNWTKIFPHECKDEASLSAYEMECVQAGYEGIIIRSPSAPYKFGRSTLNEQGMIKMVRWEHREAIINGVAELEINLDPSTDCNENKFPAATLGALLCVDKQTGAPVRVGSGFTAAQRKDIWERFVSFYNGKTVTYKHKPYGARELKRTPIFVGIRYDLPT